MSLYDPRTYQKAEGKQYVIKLAKKKKNCKARDTHAENWTVILKSIILSFDILWGLQEFIPHKLTRK